MSEQRSAEWFAERAGHASASRASDIIAKIKTGEAAVRRKYRIQLVTERLTGIPVQGYQSAAMLWGTNTEPEARSAYEVETGSLVDIVGFIRHPDHEWIGASPDGCLDDDGLIECKCPESTTHLDWMDQDRIPPEHVPQIQFQLWVTGRRYCDFVSFDPRFPEPLRLFIVRMKRDDDYIGMLRQETLEFLKDVQSLHDRLINRTPLIEQLAASLDVAGSQA